MSPHLDSLGLRSFARGLASVRRTLLLAVIVGAAASPLAAQRNVTMPPEAAARASVFTVALADGSASTTVVIGSPAGHAEVEASVLELVGFDLAASADRLRVTLEDAAFEFVAGSPFLTWDDTVLQLAFAPRAVDGRWFIPVQLLSDVLPDRLPFLFGAVDGESLVLRESEFWRGPARTEVAEPTARTEAAESTVRTEVAEPPVRTENVEPPVRTETAAAPASAPTREPAPVAQPRAGAPATPAVASPAPAPLRDPVRVIVLDPGHGGQDPGTLGVGGLREKDFALAFARAIRDELADEPDLEVYLTRDDDVLVPLWERGLIATRLKGERPGVFVSIHANHAGNRSVRGFETYFLSDARTDDERRVAALENEALDFEPVGQAAIASDPELGFILTELRNLDHIHWSSDLAEVVQRELAAVHPGPNRGVKQGPFAVITNALMPGVLLETGFVSNPTEAQLLADPAFQREAARAVARALTDFFGRYPPGQGRDPVRTPEPAGR